MKKTILVGIMLVCFAEVAMATCGCYWEESNFKKLINQCEKSGEAQDCNKAAAQAKYNACLNKCVADEIRMRR